MDDFLRMAGCWLAVASAAGPVGLAAWLSSRWSGVPLFPRPKGWRVPWTGFEVLVAYLVVAGVLPALAVVVVGGSGLAPAPVPADPPDDRARGITPVMVWAAVLIFPVQFGLLWAATRQAFAARRPTDPRGPAAGTAAGVLVWYGLAPLVLLVHAGLGWLFRAQGWETDEHPLTQLADGSTLDRALFVGQAVLAAPVVEEFLFRGVLLGWLVGGRSFLGPSDRGAAGRKVWWVLVVGGLVAAANGRGTGGPLNGPLLFAVGLTIVWVLLRQLVRRKRRTLGAVYASAALFAEVHSAVWPSPVPLFLLGLGLGWVALRTRSLRAPIVVHGLFNLVSVLYVLRGPAA